MGIVALSIATVLLALFFWNTPLLLPVKLFVVLLHEISHGVAALLTGGSVERLVVSHDEGGLAFTRGGSRFLILSAGYLGSALWGALFMRLAWAAPRRRRLLVQGSALLLLGIALFYGRDLFTLAYLALAAGALWLIGWRGGPRIQMATLWLLGTFSCLYAVIDIGTDILANGPLAGIPLIGGATSINDAQMLASVTLLPAFFWGLLWSGVALAIFGWSLASLARRGGR